MASKKRPTQQVPSRQQSPSQIDRPNPAPSAVQSPQQVGLSVQRTEHYEGFLPPHVIEVFDRTESGRAYLQELREQAKHRRELEALVIRGDNARANRGQWMAFFLAVFFGALGAGLVYVGHDTGGAAIATTSVVGLVTVFITGSYRRKSERIEKQKIMSGQSRPEEKNRVG